MARGVHRFPRPAFYFSFWPTACIQALTLSAVAGKTLTARPLFLKKDSGPEIGAAETEGIHGVAIPRFRADRSFLIVTGGAMGYHRKR